MKTLSALFVKETELTYEPGRDAIASVTNRVGLNHDKLLSQYGYAINADGQRISRTTTHGGATFTDAFGFDPDTGGLISSKRAASVDADHTYAFDKIGNREVTVSGAETPITYQPNALNQYLSIEGDSSISLTHDADGNLTRRGDRTFTWDADNRLIAIHERGILIASYTYDHKSRRIARWTRDGVDERYLYQGWNLIAVYHPGEAEPVETYTWGKDLSGSLQGAGGVGGLLFAKKRGHGKDAWIYHFDANGNVTEVTDSKGNLLDRYEYDPFGQLLSQPVLSENRYRFSTKPQDAESGFYYYGYRYYDPIDGRWISRDPLGEPGGLNLYWFVENDGINAWDYLGQCKRGDLKVTGLKITSSTLHNVFNIQDPAGLILGFLKDDVAGKVQDAATKKSKLLKKLTNAASKAKDLMKLLGLVGEALWSTGFTLDEVEMKVSFICCRYDKKKKKNTWVTLVEEGKRENLLLSFRPGSADLKQIPQVYIDVMISAAWSVNHECPVVP